MVFPEQTITFSEPELVALSDILRRAAALSKKALIPSWELGGQQWVALQSSFKSALNKVESAKEEAYR